MSAMDGPSGMCIDVNNNVYVADSDNGLIREIVVTASTGKVAGHIYNIAGVQTETDYIYGGDGGPATSANLHFPDGCSFDSHGNMYIADRGNNEIRVVIGIGSSYAGDACWPDRPLNGRQHLPFRRFHRRRPA